MSHRWKLWAPRTPLHHDEDTHLFLFYFTWPQWLRHIVLESTFSSCALRFSEPTTPISHTRITEFNWAISDWKEAGLNNVPSLIITQSNYFLYRFVIRE